MRASSAHSGAKLSSATTCGSAPVPPGTAWPGRDAPGGSLVKVLSLTSWAGSVSGQGHGHQRQGWSRPQAPHSPCPPQAPYEGLQQQREDE